MKKEKKKIKVIVAMSGGVDSAVAAALLKKQGYDVVGVHIKMWSDPEIPCLFKLDRLEAMKVAIKLGIPFLTWDLTKEYRKAVVDYMIKEYSLGRTPNPDVMCNQEVKFGVFLDKALETGADFLATGHYVKKVPNPKSQIPNRKSKVISYGLSIAKDDNKDQSYFLWTLNQKKLKHCLFPLGEYTKPQIRKMAEELKLPNAKKPDSQGICFIGEINVKDFLQHYIPRKPGKIITTEGKEVGSHEGLAFYTIGQRSGLGVGGGVPYYVVGKDFKKNVLIIGNEKSSELYKKDLIFSGANWLDGSEPKLPFTCQARIRYRQPLQKCTVIRHKGKGKKSEYQVVFDKKQRAVTSGQSIVMYDKKKMIGGGIIF